MRKDWEVKKLGDICRIEYGFPFNSKLFTSDSTFMPLIRIRDLKDFSPETFYAGEYDSNYIVRKGDYLIGMDGEFNIIKWKGNDGLLNQRICRVTSAVKELLNPFLLSYLPIPLKAIEDATPFVTVKHLSAAKINNIDVPVPPLQTQQQIVEELDCLTSIIEKQKKQLEELDNLAQSIFYDMFGDPIENEKEWPKTAFGREFKVSSGGTPDTKNHNYWDNGRISWIGSNLCQNSILYYNDGKFITEEGLLNSSAKLYSPGYVLIALVGATIGKVAMLKFTTTTNQNIAGIDVNSNKQYTSEFIFYLSQALYPLFLQLGGDKFKMANLSFIRALPLITPPLSIQQEFASKIEAIEKQKELIKKSIKETEDLFNSRMDYYFN